MEENEIKDIIVGALNTVLDERGLPHVGSGEDVQLFGEGSIIDSLDLVTIIVQIEETVRERTGKSVEVVDESSVISESSPFKTIGSLTKLVKDMVDAQ